MCTSACKDTPDGTTQKRHRTLVLSLPFDQGVKRAELTRLTPDLAAMYADKTDKTLTRDLNALRQLGLIRRQGGVVSSRVDRMDAFMPLAQNCPR